MNDNQIPPPPASSAYPIPVAYATTLPSPPKWPIVIGIISTVIAGLGLLSAPLNFIDWQALTPGPPVADPLPGWVHTYVIYATIVGIFLTALLLAGGICLLRRRPIARPFHLAYGCLTAILTLVGTIVMLNAATSPHVDPMMKPGLIGGAIGGALVGLAYPIFLLIWFSRSKVKTEVRRWRDALDQEAMGQQSHLIQP